VELARVLDKRKARKAEAGGEAGGGSKEKEKERPSAGDGKEKEKPRYKQREVADRSKGMEKKGMDSVLGSVFG
jgi:hypothetical protein